MYRIVWAISFGIVALLACYRRATDLSKSRPQTTKLKVWKWARIIMYLFGAMTSGVMIFMAVVALVSL